MERVTLEPGQLATAGPQQTQERQDHHPEPDVQDEEHHRRKKAEAAAHEKEEEEGEAEEGGRDTPSMPHEFNDAVLQTQAADGLNSCT